MWGYVHLTERRRKGLGVYACVDEILFIVPAAAIKPEHIQQSILGFSRFFSMLISKSCFGSKS
jgi:hypothetical protein